MSLSLIFRLQAAFAALWAVQLIFLPKMMFAQYQWTPSLELVALGQGCGVAMTGLAIVAYQLPNWTTAEQLKNAAKSLALQNIRNNCVYGDLGPPKSSLFALFRHNFEFLGSSPLFSGLRG